MIQDDTGMRLRFQDSRIVELHDTGHGLYDLPLHHLHADQPRPSIKETADPFSPTPAWRKTIAHGDGKAVGRRQLFRVGAQR